MATQIQITVTGALEKLKFEYPKDESGRIGGPVRPIVTSVTLDYLKKLADEKKHVVVSGEGIVTVE